MDMRTARVVTIPDGMSEEVAKCMEAGETVVFKVPGGQRIPLKMTADLQVLKLEPGENHILFQQDVYLWVHGSGMRISPDGQLWADLHDMKQIKKVFGLRKGSVSAGFYITREEGPFIVLEVREER